jgi:tetraacyldisaccharide 4'-kinase
LRSAAAAEVDPSTLAGERIAAFCGIGNPAAFRRTLEGLRYQVTAFREFPDHHAYTRADITELSTWASQCGAAALVCTHKDLVKMGVERLNGIPLWAVRVGLKLLCGPDVLDARLNQLTSHYQTQLV